MEKTPLKLKLKLGSGGGSSTPEQGGSPVHPTIISAMTEEQDLTPPSEEEQEEEEEQGEEGGGDEEVQNTSRLRHGYHDDASREKHKKSKKKKKKKEREKDRDRHKHRHHRDKNGIDEDEPPHKKPQFESSSADGASNETQVATTGSQAALQEMLQFLLQQLVKKDPQQFFTLPVTDAIAPGYSSIISQPMDFSKMQKKIDEGAYVTLSQFSHDFRLLCNNCMVYNQQDTVYYKAAKKMLHIGEKIISPERLAHLKKEILSMAQLSKEQLGFELASADCSFILDGDDSSFFSNCSKLGEGDGEKEDQSKFDGLQDDMTAEEILEQAQTAAKEAAEKLTLKKPACTLGFLRQRGDGTTSLSFLMGCEGINSETKEKPVSLGLLTGKLTQGTSTLYNCRDDKRTLAKPVKPLYYGIYSSFCPSYDSTFANLTKEESEMVYATYGNESAVQYAESISDFSKDCDVAMHLVDHLLNLLTRDQHSVTKAAVEERKRLQEEEEKINAVLYPSLEAAALEPVKREAEGSSINFQALHSLTEVGIDTSFVDYFHHLDRQENAIGTKLEENASLLQALAKEQRDRLSQPLPANLNNVAKPSQTEINLAEKVSEGLVAVARQVAPGALAPVPIVRRAMGITMMPVKSEASEQIEVDVEGNSHESTPLQTVGTSAS